MAVHGQKERKMTIQTKPFWEDSYKRPGRKDTFGGGKPGADVVKIISEFKVSGTALDLGCGEGRNALYLAHCGFNTDATDISKSGIEKLKHLSKESELNINAIQCDMRNYLFAKQYDLIVCHGCLHLIMREEWKIVIEKMKSATKVGGYHAVSVFTDDAPEPEDQKGLMVGLFKNGEIFEYYNDWEIIETNAYDFEHKHPDGPQHRHTGNRVMARKK